MNTLETLRTGIARVLELWRSGFGAEEDVLYWVLRLELTRPDGPGDRRAVLEQIPAGVSERVLKASRAIDAYFDNVRFILLDSTVKVWGTITNTLRVAAGVDTVTDAQRANFGFPMESAAMFFRAAHSDPKLAGALSQAFKPMPAADCQTLAALFDPNLEVTSVDAETVEAIVRLFGNEGPLTIEEAAAFATLKRTGLVGSTFSGTRGRG